MRLWTALVAMVVAPVHAESVAARVTATIVSFASVEVEGNSARVVSNDPDPAAWANGVPLTDAWVCVLDCAPPDMRWASR